MLIGNVLEKTDAQAAWQMCAGRVADWVRTSWQAHQGSGDRRWEEGLSEDPNALPGLRAEGFKGLVGLDYVFKWWGADDSEELAGQLDVMWKIVRDDDEDGATDGVNCYRTWIKLAERDFILGLYREEPAKREANKNAFVEAFGQWRELFQKL